jgi:hypothetical protein
MLSGPQWNHLVSVFEEEDRAALTFAWHLIDGTRSYQIRADLLAQSQGESRVARLLRRTPRAQAKAHHRHSIKRKRQAAHRYGMSAIRIGDARDIFLPPRRPSTRSCPGTSSSPARCWALTNREPPHLTHCRRTLTPDQRPADILGSGEVPHAPPDQGGARRGAYL